MTVANVLEEVKKWLDKEICKDLLFKVPPNIESVDTKDYIYKEVTPKSFIMYPSFEDKFPSVTVQFNGGEIGVIEKSGEMKLRFLFATWNPGLHYEIDNDRKFKVNTEGWKDAFHFMQVTLRKLLNSNYIGPYLKIKHEDKIQFGPINENETLPNYYPYWCAWITCTVSFGNFNNDKDICNLI